MRSHLLTLSQPVGNCTTHADMRHIGIEAYGSVHHWARKLQEQGHTVRLMAPQFVNPYVKTNKHDVANAEAICEAVRRPNMRFVPIKNIEQQAILAVHRIRQGLIKARTAQVNQIREFLSEFGLVLPIGIRFVYQRVPILLDQAKGKLPGMFQELIWRLLDHLQDLDRQVNELERLINVWHRSNALSRKLEKVPGIGPVTASALVASIGDATSFANGRQLAAWLGLAPRQHSSDEKMNLLGISKRGDTDLRTLLIHGGRAIIRCAGQKPPQTNSWWARLLARCHKNVATVALVNENARIVWALLPHDREFRADYAEA